MEKSKSYSFSKKFVEGETLSGFWSLAFYGIIALNSFIVLRLVSVYEYGLYQLVISIVAIAESLTAGFLDDLVLTDLSRYLGDKKNDLAKRLFFELALVKMSLAVLFTVIIIGGAEIIARYYDSNIALLLRIVGTALIFRVGLSVMNLFFDSNIYFSALGAPVFGEVVKLAVVLALWFWQGLGVTQILIAYVIGHISAFIFSSVHFVVIYRRVFSSFSMVRRSLIKELLRVYGFWVGLKYALSRVTNNIRPWIIKIFTTTEAVGLYMFASSLAAIIMRLMPLGTFGILLPRELGDKIKLRYLFARVTKYSVFLSFVFSVLSFIFVPMFIGLVFPKYTSAVPLFLIMTGVIFLYGFYKIFRMVLVVFKEQKTLTIRSLDGSILSPLLLVILLPIFGVNGAAMEWVLTYAVTTVLFYYYLIKAHPYLKLRWKDFLPDKHDGALTQKIYQQSIIFLKSKFKIYE